MKLAASKSRFRVGQTRSGRRPMSVDTMLRKEKDGTLYKDKLSIAGGLAASENKKPEDFDPRQLKMGIEVEKEHTSDPEVAKRISMDHLCETPDYYSRLKRMEDGVEKKATPLPIYWQQLAHKEKQAFKLQGHTEVQGIPIAIENQKGSIRKGVDKDGHEWRTEMKHPYGYIVGTKGADGEPVDAYVGPHKDSPHAFAIHQHKPDGKGFDEDKLMLGFKNKQEAVKGYLKHYDDPKFLGPVSILPMGRLQRLIETGKKLFKISQVNSDQSNVEFRDSDNPQITGKSVDPKKKKGDGPSREDVETFGGKPGYEPRQDSARTQVSDAFPAPAEYANASKYAQVLPPIGNQRRPGEGPTRNDVGKAMPEKNVGLLGESFSDLTPVVQQDERKTAAMVDELDKLGAISDGQSHTLKLKLPERKPITREQTELSLKKLKRLEEGKLTPGELGRGAMVGAILGPIGAHAARAIEGVPIYKGPRNIAASAAMGALYGSLIPVGKSRLEREVNKQKLKEYLGTKPRGTLRSKIKRTLGV